MIATPFTVSIMAKLIVPQNTEHVPHFYCLVGTPHLVLQVQNILQKTVFPDGNSKNPSIVRPPNLIEYAVVAGSK